MIAFYLEAWLLTYLIPSLLDLECLETNWFLCCSFMLFPAIFIKVWHLIVFSLFEWNVQRGLIN